MNLVITGTPGSGKSTLAFAMSKKLGFKVINEKDFALKNGLGYFDDSNELVIPVKEFELKANSFLSKKSGYIFEGHTLCEMKLKVDFVILISVNPEILELRLEKRNYSAEKIYDNVFCEGIEYCKKMVLKNYPKSKIIFINSKQSFSETFIDALISLKEKIEQYYS